MEITRQSKLFDVLEAYPFLEAQIINIAPPFKNLKNPLLRRTVGKLATLEKVAQIGGMDVNQLINTLRRGVGQVELAPETASHVDIEIPSSPDDPAWINTEPQFVVNGTDLLKHGEVPLGRVNELLEELVPGKCILLFTNFEPFPIMDAMKKQNRLVFHKVHPAHPDQHMTYIQ